MSIDRNRKKLPGETGDEYIARLRADFIKKYGKEPGQVAVIEKSREKRTKPPEINVHDILLTGTMEQVQSLKCPVCGGGLYYEYSVFKGSTGMRCKCGVAPKDIKATQAPKYIQFLTV
jgi:hypothetical protein